MVVVSVEVDKMLIYMRQYIKNSLHQQKAILRQIRWCCVLTLRVWTLRPVRPVRPVVRRHIWLRLERLDTLLSTGLRPDTCNQPTLRPIHSDFNLNTIAHQDLPLPLSTLPAFKFSDSEAQP